MRDDSFVLTSPVQVFHWILSPGDLDHVFLAFFGHFHHIKVRRVHLLISITRPMMTFSQGICDKFQKQTARCVPGDAGVSEVHCYARVEFH